MLRVSLVKAARAAGAAPARAYSMCDVPRAGPQGCVCPPLVPAGSRRIVPPADCRPGPIFPNPCCPAEHAHENGYLKWKILALFVFFPLIIIQYLRVYDLQPEHKEVCRHYEYMRLRSKRFPWGDGKKSFFHNDHVNSLPEECEVPPYPCDD